MSDTTVKQAPVVVRPVETKAEFRAFFEFPWIVNKDDPNWVPPLLSMRRNLLDKAKNPAWAYLEGQYFAAWRGDQIVGTITAFINHHHNEFWNENIGWFGTFETLDDPEAAQALLDTATAWVQARGYDAIRGPQSFTTHEETGLLIEGFEPNLIMMPYNKPYYASFIEAAQFEKVMDTVSVYLDKDTFVAEGSLDRLDRMLERVNRVYNFSVRYFDPKNKAADFRLFRDLYNVVWDGNWGFTPMTDAELDALVNNLGILVDARFAFFIYDGDDPIGFGLAVPDFNEAIHLAYPRPGEPEAWTLLKVLWHWRVRKAINGTRFVFFGVKEAYRGTGVALLVLRTMSQSTIDSEYQYVDMGWILETNPLLSVGLKLGTQIYRRYRYYEKRFDGQPVGASPADG